MIGRTWVGRAPQENAEAYLSFLEGKVFKDIRGIDGYHGAYVLRRPVNGNKEVEFLVITFWKSMEAVHKFAGDDPTVAVVEDEARVLLSAFDEHVNHYEVLHSPG
jgi:heme-degrading monooxygenase HmoA